MREMHAVGEPTKYVVVNADDFGSSSSVNEAIEQAGEWGFLTSASIMAGGDAFEEAVNISFRRPALSVGLHVTLSEGCPILPAEEIPDLVGKRGLFVKSPARAGIRYWRLRNRIAGQIRAEVKAQFDKVKRAGIHPTHVDCHHHLHMHPLVFAIVAAEAAERGVEWIRIPREPLSLLLGSGPTPSNVKAFFFWLVMGLLGRWNLRKALRCGVRVVDNVYGFSGTGGMHEKNVLEILPHMKCEANEIYLHPDLGSWPGREELKALTSWKIRSRLRAMGLKPVGFRELGAALSCLRPHADSIANGHG
jgi:hopanoid biosynthesis associated protein HpnK